MVGLDVETLMGVASFHKGLRMGLNGGLRVEVHSESRGYGL
jgi:hypothetical protein